GSLRALTLPTCARPRQFSRSRHEPSRALHLRSRRPLPPRPRQALPAHGQARAGTEAPHHRDSDVPRDGYAVLPGAGGGGDRNVTEKLIDGLTKSHRFLRQGNGQLPRWQCPADEDIPLATTQRPFSSTAVLLSSRPHASDLAQRVRPARADPTMSSARVRP